MPSWVLIKLALQHGLGWLSRHWRVWLLATIALCVGLYIRSAERAKVALRDAHTRAAMADGLISIHQQRADSLTTVVVDLKARRPKRDAKFGQTVQATAQRRVIVVDPTPPGIAADSMLQPQDTVVVAELPEVKQLIAECEMRVSLRDTIIATQDERHVQDSLAVARLRDVIASQRPPTRSKWPTVLKVAAGAVATGLVIGVVR